MSKGSVRSPRKNQVRIAVNEPLELCLRAQLGRRGRNQVRIAVIELLELCLRALLGRRGRNQVRML